MLSLYLDVLIRIEVIICIGISTDILLGSIRHSMVTATPRQAGSYCTSINHCYTLYGGAGTDINWYDARNTCHIHGLQLVSIQDEYTAEILRDKSLFQLSYTGAWTAGRQSDGSGWRDTAGQLVSASTIHSSDTDGWNCVYATITSDGVVKYFAYDCFHDQMLPLCQTQRKDGCHGHEFLHNGICYMILAADRTSWYDAYMLCKAQGHGTVMAHSGIHRLDFTHLLWTHISQAVWLGVHRRPWFWDTSSGYHLSFQLALYKWDRDDDDNFMYEGCLVLKDDLSTWGDARCTEQIDYFICETSNFKDDETISPLEQTSALTTHSTYLNLDTTTTLQAVCVAANVGSLNRYEVCQCLVTLVAAMLLGGGL